MSDAAQIDRSLMKTMLENSLTEIDTLAREVERCRTAWVSARIRALRVRDDGDLSDCPYYRGVGECDRACWDEPTCVTSEPRHGWATERVKRSLARPVMTLDLRTGGEPA